MNPQLRIDLNDKLHLRDPRERRHLMLSILARNVNGHNREGLVFGVLGA